MPLDKNHSDKSLKFDNKEDAREYLSEMTVPQWVDAKLERVDNHREPTQEELDGGFRKLAIVALRPGEFNGVPYDEDLLKKHADSWVKQPNGRQGYFKMNHGNDVLKRAGPIEESYWCEDKGVIIHKGKLTVPEFIERWDAGVLDTTSVEMGVGFDLEKSKPGKLIPSIIQGRDNSFVENPACKTCGTNQLEMLELYLEDTDIETLNDVMLQTKELCEAGTAEADALWSLFSSMYGRFFNNLDDKELPVELTGEGSMEALKKLHDANLDKDGKCKLDPADDMGHCLSVPNVKRLTGNALGLGNTNYLRPIMYEGFRQGKISPAILKKAGYDPESPSLKGVNNMVKGNEEKDEKSLRVKLLEVLGVKSEDLEDKTLEDKKDKDKKDENLDDSCPQCNTALKDGVCPNKACKTNNMASDDNDPPIDDPKVIADLKAGCSKGDKSDCDELEEQGIDTSKLADDTSDADPAQVAKLTAECKDGKIASCGALRKLGIKLEDIGVDDVVEELEDKKTEKTVAKTLEEQGMVAIKAEDLETLKEGITSVVSENKVLVGRLEVLETDKVTNAKELHAQKTSKTKSEILGSAKALSIKINPEDLKQGEKEEDDAYSVRLESQLAGYKGVMQKFSIEPLPYIEPMELGSEKSEQEKVVDKKLEDLEKEMDNLYLGENGE